LYGIEPPSDEANPPTDGMEDDDIETSIQRELDAMREPRKVGSKDPFVLVRSGLECVFFIKVRSPADPIGLVQAICEDAKACPNPMDRRTRFLNRIVPITTIGKATEKAVVSLARQVMAPLFDLKPENGEAGPTTEQGTAESTAYSVTYSSSGVLNACCISLTCLLSQYAIRPNLRNHSSLKSKDLIDQIAAQVGPSHKVNLTSPDKVLLIEIFKVRYSPNQVSLQT
jgi:tRNA acetyltransferase TAN1